MVRVELLNVVRDVEDEALSFWLDKGYKVAQSEDIAEEKSSRNVKKTDEK